MSGDVGKIIGMYGKTPGQNLSDLTSGGASASASTTTPSVATSVSSTKEDEKKDLAAKRIISVISSVMNPMGSGKRFGSSVSGESFLFNGNPSATNNPKAADKRSSILGIR